MRHGAIERRALPTRGATPSDAIESALTAARDSAMKRPAPVGVSLDNAAGWDRLVDIGRAVIPAVAYPSLSRMRRSMGEPAGFRQTDGGARDQTRHHPQ